MPGPYDDIYLDPAYRDDGLEPLAVLGGYSKVNRIAVRNVNTEVDAEENNKIRSAIANVVARDKSQRITLTDYDLTVGSGQTQAVRNANLIKLRAAVADAMSSGVPLYVPPGVYEFETYQANTYATDIGTTLTIGVYIDDDFSMYGDGADVTEMKFYPDAPSYVLSHFYVDSYDAAHDFSLSGITFTGPTSSQAATGGDVTTIPASRLIYHQGHPTTERSETFRIFDCEFSGKWYETLTSADGITFWDVRNCYFSGEAQACSFFATSHNKKRVHLTDVVIDCHTAGGNGNHDQVGVYIHPTINLRVRGFVARNIKRFGLYIRGEGGAIDMSNPPIPVECDLQNLTLESTCVKGMRTNQIIPTVIRGLNCYASDTSVEILGTTTLTGFYIKNGTGSSGGSAISQLLTGYTGQTANISISDGVININSSSGGAIALMSHGSIRGVHFRGGSPGGVTYVQMIAGCHVEISDCHFDGESSLGGSGPAALQVTHASGSAKMGRCRVGANCRALQQGDTLDHVELVDNEILTNGAALYTSFTSSGNGKVRGYGNRWASTSTPQNYSGSLGFQSIGFGSGLNPTTVSSGTTMTYDPTYDLTRVSGTATIETINILGANANAYFSGTMRLKATAAWALATSGNIVTTNTSAHSAGDIVTLTYDPIAAKWTEV